jgi:hypothetical protein
MVLTNKHVVIAMVVAPVLAVLAWFATGQLAGEKPRPAEQGKSYPLVEKSNCRYPSGACDLQNEEFRLRIAPAGEGGRELVLISSHPLDGVVLGIGLPEENPRPEAMRAADGQGLEWRLVMAGEPLPQYRIRLVALAEGSQYFADADTAFLQPRDHAGNR